MAQSLKIEKFEMYSKIVHKLFFIILYENKVDYLIIKCTDVESRAHKKLEIS